MLTIYGKNMRLRYSYCSIRAVQPTTYLSFHRNMSVCAIPRLLLRIRIAHSSSEKTCELAVVQHGSQSLVPVVLVHDEQCKRLSAAMNKFTLGYLAVDSEVEANAYVAAARALCDS